jgi:protein SCO1/2
MSDRHSRLPKKVRNGNQLSTSERTTKASGLWATVGAALIGLFSMTAGVAAHGPDEVAAEFHDREPFFQAIGKPAPNFILQDADGNTVQLTDLAEKIVVLNFIYTSCPDVCPLHSRLFADVQAMTADAGMSDIVQFVSITTDPGTDTPQIMDEYGPIHGLDPDNWTFLTLVPGQQEALTRELAEAYGHGFSPTEENYQVHGIVTHVIARGGRWEANFHGLDPDPLNMVLFLNALANHWEEHPKPPTNWWQRLLERF